MRRHMMWVKGFVAVATLVTLSTLVGFAQAQPLKNVAAIARDIAEGVGNVGQVLTGNRGVVFLFEEYHTSRVGQLQMAIMLLRLRERYGVKTVALEGAIQSPRPLDGSWFHAAGGPNAADVREDVAVRMLAEGEISAAEFMTLLFPDVQVRGTEIEREYAVRLDVKGSPEVTYLLLIGSKLLTQDQIRQANQLIQENKKEEALEYILTRDAWVRRQYEARKDPRPRPIDETAKQAREIESKANALGVTVDPAVKEDMAKLLRFYDTAARRSDTMMEYVVERLGVGSGGAAAMIVGAAHTPRIVDLLRSQRVSVARIAPKALNPKRGNLTFEQFERKNEGKFVRQAVGTLGAILNSHRKPQPVIGNLSQQSYASAYMAAGIVAKGARLRKRIPDDVWAQISTLPELRVDRDSFTLDGYDAIFRVWAKDTSGREREVWIRVGSPDRPGGAQRLEEKLLQAAADLGGGGRVPPRTPPANSEAADDEGPGDGKRGEMVINRIGTDAIAVFAGRRDQVLALGRVSG